MKRCPRCETEKPLEDFAKRSDRAHRQTYCRPCMSEYQKAHYQRNREKAIAAAAERRRRDPDRNIGYAFGLTGDEVRALRRRHDDRCSVCGIHQSEVEKRHCIDHCHDTGHIRGLLCGPCNRGLGLLKDDPLRLRRAAQYVESARLRFKTTEQELTAA